LGWKVHGQSPAQPLVDYADDILTVLIEPLDVTGEPQQDPRQMVNCMNEVSSNASWVWEMRQIELINQLLKDHQLFEKEHIPEQSKHKRYKRKRFHVIRNDAFMEKIGSASKTNPSRDLFVNCVTLAGDAPTNGFPSL
jgi:NTE family protein